jgi:hypothetical protein
MFDPDICERCGRDLNALGRYKDLVHYRADTEDRQVPCLTLSKELQELVDDMAKHMVRRMEKLCSILEK